MTNLSPDETTRYKRKYYFTLFIFSSARPAADGAAQTKRRVRCFVIVRPWIGLTGDHWSGQSRSSSVSSQLAMAGGAHRIAGSESGRGARSL